MYPYIYKGLNLDIVTGSQCQNAINIHIVAAPGGGLCVDSSAEHIPLAVTCVSMLHLSCVL